MDTLTTTAPRSAPTTPAGRSWRDRTWLVPTGLLFLAFVPSVAGAARLTELAGRPEVTADNARFVASPVPVVAHVVGVVLFAVLGAFQFTPAFRRRHRRWHRRAGRVVVAAGAVAALSGLWMTHAYDLPASDGPVAGIPVLGLERDLVGTAMLVSLVLAVVTARRRDLVSHGHWMIRAYALGMGAGTQVFTSVPWFVLVGTPTSGVKAVQMAAGWLINLAVAEWLIRRGPASVTGVRRSPTLVP